MSFSDSPIPGAPSIVPGTPTSVPGTPTNIPGSAPIINLSGGNITLRSGAVVENFIGFVELQNNLIKYTQEVENLRHAVCQKLAPLMEAWAKENAPWQDRTGDARDQLVGVYVAESGPGTSAALISNAVEYGVYLETMQGGAFQICLPTILHFVAELANLETEVGFEFLKGASAI